MEKTKQVRLNSEKTLPHNSFKIKIGSTNKKQPYIVYVEGKTFITPNEEKDDYKNDVRDIKHNLHYNIRNVTIKNDYLQTGQYILDFQLATNGIKKNKKSFLTFEFLLRQPKEHVLKLDEVKKHTENDIYEIFSSLEENLLEHNFSLSKTKN